jgi:2-methylisocitrate lyase-like PEP mutase family enzyme
MSQNFPSQPDIFRQTLRTHPLVEAPGCYDALTAMIIEQVGFKSIFISGNSIAASVLGNPDIGLTSLLETSYIVKNIVKIP